MAGQKLADELHGVRGYTENALPATALHQTFWGSGFRGGRVIPRGWGSRNAGFGSQSMSRGRAQPQTTQFSNRGMHNSRGNNDVMAGRRGRGRQSRGEPGRSRSMHCFTCGGFGHVSVQCLSDFQGMCHSCGQWGHTSRYCTAQQAHVSTDEFECAQDGYAYNPNSDYYQSYAEAYADESKQAYHSTNLFQNFKTGESKMRLSGSKRWNGGAL